GSAATVEEMDRGINDARKPAAEPLPRFQTRSAVGKGRRPGGCRRGAASRGRLRQAEVELEKSIEITVRFRQAGLPKPHSFSGLFSCDERRDALSVCYLNRSTPCRRGTLSSTRAAQSGVRLTALTTILAAAYEGVKKFV